MSVRRITIRDVAERLNISHATVSRALNRPNDNLISEDTRRRVQEVAREMGYRPNPAARALVTGRTNLVSLWLWAERPEDTYQANIEHMVHQMIEPTNYEISINLVGTRTVAHAHDFALTPVGVDGIISHEAGPALLAVLGHEHLRNLPTVCTGSYNSIEGLDFASLDYSHGAFSAVRHLVTSGRKRIAYMVSDNQKSTIEDVAIQDYSHDDPRYLAYAKVMSDAALPQEFIGTIRSRARAREAIKAYVSRYGAPEALFCHSDEIAIGAYRGLLDLGLSIPGDVAIVGCDGIQDTEYLEVPISTIVAPLKELFDTAWGFLSDRINDRTREPQFKKFDCEFVIRESCH